MKKDIVKGFLVLVVTVSMSAMLFACKPGPGNESDVSSSAQSSSSQSEEAPDKSPITLTIGMVAQNCTIGDGINQEYYVLEEITEQTGVTLDFVTYDPTKFKVLASGGDLPDLISIEGTDATIVDTLISSGALLQLDELLAEYGDNILKNNSIGLKWSKQIVGNGKTYIMPVMTTIADLSSPTLIGGATFNSRYDIYDAIGAPKIYGENSYLNVLKQMQDHQRTETGNNKVYALSAWSDWGLWPYIISYPFAYGFMNSNNNHSLNLETGEMEHNFLKEDGVFWNGMYFFNKAYRMGIFDPEGFTMKYAQYEAKVMDGTLLTQAAMWIVPDAAVCGENAIMTQLPGAFPVLAQVYDSENPFGFGKSGARAINASCDYPERAMQLLNYFDSEEGARTLKNGLKGTDWDVIDGKATLIGARLEAIKAGKLNEYEIANPSGIGGPGVEIKADLAQFWTSGEFETSDGLPINLQNTKEMKALNATPAQKNFARSIDAELTYPGQVYEKWINDGIAKTVTSIPLAASLIAGTSTETQQAESQAAEYFVANIAKIIMAKDDTEFNAIKAAMINDIKAMGIEAAEEEYQSNYRAAESMVDSFMGQP